MLRAIIDYQDALIESQRLGAVSEAAEQAFREAAAAAAAGWGRLLAAERAMVKAVVDSVK